MAFQLKESVPIKYRLGIHSAIPSYPTSSDIEFDLISYIIYVIDVKNKEFDLEKLRFTKKTLKYIFKEKLDDPSFKTIFIKLLKEHIEQGNIEKQGDTFYVSPEVYHKYYKTSSA